MAYESRTLRRQKVRYNSDNADHPIVYQRVLEGAKATPSAVTITVFAPGNATAVLAETAMTVSGTVATYSLDTTTTTDFPVATGYRGRIKATIGGTDYLDDIQFDVAPYLLYLAIGRDQLVALDDRIDGMEWAGDEDFSEIIEAVRDELQARIESKVIQDKRLLETMILDQSRVAIPARFLVLSRIWRAKGEDERAEQFREDFNELWRVALDSIQYDADEDGEEDSRMGGLQFIRRRY